MEIESLFQIIFYNLRNDKKRTPLYVMNAVEIYVQCKSRELITLFNRSGLCSSYASGYNSYDFSLPIPSHISPSTFTISVFDNFDHVDNNTLSSKSVSHDTVITSFQAALTKKEPKPNISEVNVAPVKTLRKVACQELVPF